MPSMIFKIVDMLRKTQHQTQVPIAAQQAQGLKAGVSDGIDDETSDESSCADGWWEWKTYVYQ